MLMITATMALSLSSVILPTGTVELPAGCRGPKEISWLIDSYIGEILCDKDETRIWVTGSSLAPPTCTKTESAELKSRFGAPILVCLKGASPTAGEQVMFAEVGDGNLHVFVKRPRDMSLLLQVVASFKPSRKK